MIKRKMKGPARNKQVGPYVFPGIIENITKKEKFQSRPKEVSAIISLVAAKCGVDEYEIVSHSRHSILIIARMLCYSLMRARRYTFCEIGRIFDGRDHATIISALDRFDKLCETEPELLQKLKELKRKL